MFDNKTLKVQSAQETLFPRLKCVCVRTCGALQNGQANYTMSFGRVQTIKYTQKCHNDQLREYSLKQFVLSGPELFGENPMCVNILP